MKLMPEPNYKSVFHQERFKATWSVNLFVLVSMSLLSVFEGIEGSSLFKFVFTGALLGVSNIAVMLIYKTYKITAYSFAVLGMAILSYVLLTDYSMLHYNNFAWMICVVIFVFFVLGRIAGIILLLYSFVVINIFIHYNLNVILDHIDQLTAIQVYNMSITYILAGATMMYVVNKFTKVYLRSEQRVVEINKELLEKNEVVEKKNIQNELMLKEIHHRVKNNLQIVSSMLRLQSREINDDSASKYFSDAVNRVSVMALVHEKMYQNNLEKIEPTEYFEALTKSILEAYSSTCDKLIVDVKVSVDQIGLITLVPLALIVNELMTNSLKYAYEDCDHPKLSLSLTQDNETNYSLIYSDNGSWKQNENLSYSFGLELVEALTEQLDGTIIRTYENGTTFKIMFKNQDR